MVTRQVNDSPCLFTTLQKVLKLKLISSVVVNVAPKRQGDAAAPSLLAEDSSTVAEQRKAKRKKVATPPVRLKPGSEGLPELLGNQPLRLIIVGSNPSDHAWYVLHPGHMMCAHGYQQHEYQHFLALVTQMRRWRCLCIGLHAFHPETCTECMNVSGAPLEFA